MWETAELGGVTGAEKADWDRAGLPGYFVGFEVEIAASGKSILHCEEFNAPSGLWGLTIQRTNPRSPGD